MLAAALASTDGTAQAAAGTAPVSAGHALLDQAIAILAARPLGHESVDWQAVRTELAATLPAAADARAAHAAIRTAVARLGNRHAQFLPPPEPPPPPKAEPTAEPPAKAKAMDTDSPRRIPTAPEGAMLDGDVAYLLLPGCMTGSVDGLRSYASTLRAGIADLEAHAPKGWILDLRLNAGGNVWPMLLGLWPLLGDGEHAGSLSADGTHRLGIDARHAWLRTPGATEPTDQLTLDLDGEPQRARPTKVAVLTGAWTMSSAEVVTLAFAHTADARRFGQPTAGLTTANDHFPLADGSVLNLPIAWQCDRTGWAPRGAIEPDQQVESGDWPTRDDATVRAAREWLR